MRGSEAGRLAIIACAFAIAHCQAPVYYSNQNQYFLHGLALAGEGSLASDWLAQTRDPTPLFSSLVAGIIRLLGEWPFYVIYFAMLGIYAITLYQFARWYLGERFTGQRAWVFVALLILVHAAMVRSLSYRWLGGDYPWYLQAGVAGQYVLGGYWQPSTFGILLITSIVLFLRDRWRLAAVCVGVAATMHSTYLLPGAFLTIAFQVSLTMSGRWRDALKLGLLTLLLVIPGIAYVIATFAPTDTATFTEAQRILVHVRIPHHTLPHLWCDKIAVGQIVWMMIGIALTWGTRLFPILATLFGLGTLFTLVQIVTASDALALMFPWRVSALIVPLATAVILSRLARPMPMFASVGAVSLLVMSGIVMTVTRQGFQVNENERPLLAWVRTHAAREDVYLLPVSIPNLAKTTRGSLSSDHKPLASKKTDQRIIPVDLQQFRLATGVPIYIDFKSVAYADIEVLEWYERLQQVQTWYQQMGEGEWPKVRAELRSRGITHVVLTADRVLPADAPIYADEVYRVIAVGE